MGRHRLRRKALLRPFGSNLQLRPEGSSSEYDTGATLKPGRGDEKRQSYAARPHRITTGLIAEAFICYLFPATAFSQAHCIMNRFLDSAFNEMIPASQTSPFPLFQHDHAHHPGLRRHRSRESLCQAGRGVEGMTGIFINSGCGGVTGFGVWASPQIPGREQPRLPSPCAEDIERNHP